MTSTLPLPVLLAKRELSLEKRKAELARENQIFFYQPHPKQQSFHTSANFHYRYARTGNRFGKALAHYERVVTMDGLKKISDVVVGDYVFDHEGRMTKVLGVFPQGSKQVYRFHFDDNTTLDCCAEHVWTTKGPKERWHDGDWKQSTTEQIIAHVGLEPKNAKSRYVIPLTKPVQWLERELPLDPYLLGALLGDGGMTGQTVSFTTWDEEILQHVMTALPKGSCLKTNTNRPGQYWISGEYYNTGEGRVSSNLIVPILATLGLQGKDSYTKFIPTIYLLASIEQRQNLLQGLLDTDGTVDKKGLSAEYTTCSPTLANGVQFLLQSLGHKTTVVARTTFDQNNTPCVSYRIGIRQPQKELFRLSRKRDLLGANDFHEKQRVIYRIEKLNGEEPCFCIAVDSPLHTFLATNFVVTHNSEMGAAEDVAFALGYRPWLPEGSPLRTLGIPPHPTKGLIVTTDWDKSTEVFTSVEAGPSKGKLFKYIPTSKLISHTKNHSGAIDTVKVRHVNGGVSVIHLDTVKSFKQNPLGQESSAWDWVHFDEPIPEQMFKAILRGTVDRGGRMWFTCTPLTEPWIDEKFIPDLESQSRDDVNFAHGDFWMMTGSTDDNPFNKPEDIERVMSQYTVEERETRRSGRPTAYSGIVYKEFNWNLHVLRDAPVGWKDWQHPPENFSLRFAIDYHPRKPHHVLFIATSPHEVQYVYSEVFYSCLMSELLVEIKRVLNSGEPTVPGLIDPLASTPNRVTDLSPLDELLRLGLAVMPATKDPHNGILKVKEFLRQRDRSGSPTMFFNAAMPRTLMEISRGYVWDGETNKPVKDKDDAMENLYRLCLQGLEYIEPAKFTDYVPIAPRELPPNIIDAFEFFSDDSAKKANEKKARFRQRYAI